MHHHYGDRIINHCRGDALTIAAAAVVAVVVGAVDGLIAQIVRTLVFNAERLHDNRQAT